MTDKEPDKAKRSRVPPPPPRPGSPTFEDWRGTRSTARKSNTIIRTGSVQFADSKDSGGMPIEQSNQGEAPIQRRWFGFFTAWLKKLTFVEQKDKGELPMGLEKSLLIYSARAGCAKSNLQAGLDIHADARKSLSPSLCF